MLLCRPPYCLFRWAFIWASRTVVVAYILEVFAAMLYPRHICMLKGVLFSLFTSSVRLLSGSTKLSPQQYRYLAWSIASSAMLFSGPLYCFRRWALTWAWIMFTANILEVFASFLYLRHICMLKGVLFSLFPSSIMLVLRSTLKSPQQYWYLGLGYCLLGNALICSFVLSPKVSSYQHLKNCRRSIYPLGICSIVIPAAYLNAEGCIVFTFHFISKPHISVYNIVSSAMLISGL